MAGSGFVTGYTVHTGSNKKFAAGWEQIFGFRKKKKTSASDAKPSAARRTAQAKKKK
jgi:hypothetical protein